MLKRELAVKYRNAIPLDISESTFGKCQLGIDSVLFQLRITPLFLRSSWKGASANAALLHFLVTEEN